MDACRAVDTAQCSSSSATQYSVFAICSGPEHFKFRTEFARPKDKYWCKYVKAEMLFGSTRYDSKPYGRFAALDTTTNTPMKISVPQEVDAESLSSHSSCDPVDSEPTWRLEVEPRRPSRDSVPERGPDPATVTAAVLLQVILVHRSVHGIVPRPDRSLLTESRDKIPPR